MAEDIVREIRKQGDSYLVKLSSGDSIRVAGPLLRQHALRVGQAVDTERYLESLRQDAYPFALEKAVKLLSQRDYSRHQVEDKLLKSGYDEETVDKVADFLVKRRYLDDRRFAEALLKRKQGKSGTNRIAMELRAKGVDQELAAQALAQFSQDDELEAARTQALRYLASKALEPGDAYRRTIAFLARRGYPYEVAKKAYTLAAGEPEDRE